MLYKKSRISVVVIILAVPFFVLYWLVPFASKYTIGIDYTKFWIDMQLYLRFSLEHGTFPLYAPGFNGGWTSSALTLGQLWHPISWLAANLPGYWTGHAHEIGTLLRLFSLGGVHLVLFFFLRRLRLDITLAFLISFITTYNLRMLDMFRYGASLENYTAFLLLCVMIAWCYVTPKKRLGAICIAVSTYLLVVGGHPQMMYYGLLGAAIICLITPFYMVALLPEEASITLRRLWKFYLTVGIWVSIGVLLSLFYSLPFYFEYVRESSRGINPSFQWACGHQDNLGGNLCNLFNPFHSNVHGAFGGSSLILLAALIPLLRFFKVRIPWAVLLLWLTSVIIFVMMIGSNGPLYYYFWQYFPLVQSFRIPGRVGLILPFMLMLLLTWLARCEPLRFQIRGRDVRLSPLALAATAGLLLFVLLNSLPLEAFQLKEGYVPLTVNKTPSMAMPVFIIVGGISLAALVFYATTRHLRLVAAVLIVAVIFQTTVMLRYGTWIKLGPKKTLTLEKMCFQQQKQLSYRPASGDMSNYSINRHLSRTFLEPTLARICPRYTVVDSLEKAYKCMSRERSITMCLLRIIP